MCENYIICLLAILLLVFVGILAVNMDKKESYCVDISGKSGKDKGGPGYSCGFECSQGCITSS